MVSYEQHDAVALVRQGLDGRGCDEQTLSSAMTLAERLGRIQQLGGAFEKVSFSPQMQALLSGHLVGAAGCAV